MQYHSYFFFDTEPTIHALSGSQLSSAKKDFLARLSKEKDVRFKAYSTLGFKAGTRFMLHCNADAPEKMQLLLRDLLHTALGKHVKLAYTLFGLTRSSQYSPHHPPKEADWNLPHTYLVVYPFTKTTEWHLKPHDERKKIMWNHVQVGKKHSEKVSQRLLYSYGIDDHEFVVSYYMNNLEDFVQLVMDMRATQSRAHTKNDLPIFTCTHVPIEEALDTL